MLGDDLDVWDAVRAELRATLRGLQDHKDGPIAAPIFHRLAVMRLQRGLLEDLDAVRATLGEALEGAELETLDGHLLAVLGGDEEAPPVLGALRPAVRAEAMLQLHEALQCDAEHVPSLLAATALATVSGRWNEAVAWLERHANAEPGERGVKPLLRLGEVHWRKLGQHDAARRCFLDARARAGEDPTVLDKLLKLDLDLSNWEEAVETCLALIQQVDEEPEGTPLKVTYLLTLGEIHVYGVQRPAEALLYYLQALYAMPDYALTYTLLRELLESTPWSALVDKVVTPAASAHLSPYVDLLNAAAEAHPESAEAQVSHLRKAVLEI